MFMCVSGRRLRRASWWSNNDRLAKAKSGFPAIGDGMAAGMFGMTGVMSRTGAVSYGLMAIGRAIVAAGIGLRVIGGAADFASLP